MADLPFVLQVMAYGLHVDHLSYRLTSDREKLVFVRQERDELLEKTEALERSRRLGFKHARNQERNQVAIQ